MVAEQNVNQIDPKSRSATQYPSSKLSRGVLEGFLARHKLKPSHLDRLLGANNQLMYRRRRQGSRPSAKYMTRLADLENVAHGLREHGMELSDLQTIYWDIEVAVRSIYGVRKLSRTQVARKLGTPNGERWYLTPLDFMRQPPALEAERQKAEREHKPPVDMFRERPSAINEDAFDDFEESGPF